MQSFHERKRVGYLEGFVSIFVNTALFMVKIVVGVMCNSIAVIADSVHTLSDSLTSIVVVAGYRMGSKPPDKEHPFGHGRAEELVTLIIASMLFMTGLDFTIRSIEKFLSGESYIFSWLLVTVMAVSALVKEGLALWAFWLGKKYNAQPILADAWHHRSDAIASALLAIAFAFGRNIPWLDSALGIVVSAIIIVTSINILAEPFTELLGKAPTSAEVKRIVDLVKRTSPLVLSVHHIHVHRYGDHVEVTLHIHLPDDTSLFKAHEVATEIEEALRRELGYEATVHVEPVSARRLRNHQD
jgi:cation diffusion facilitator family transporter